MAMTAKIPLIASPSLLCNNLSALGNHLSYCHLNEACVVDLQDTAGGISSGIQGQERKTLQQVCLVQFRERVAVVLATSNDLQVWDVNLQQQLFEWQLSTDKAQGTSPALCYRGVSLVDTEDNACLLCVGSSTGVIHTFEADRPDQIHHSYDLQHHTSSIAALASGQTLGCSSTTDGSLLASCDDGGGVTVFQANSANDFAIRHTWEGHGVPCVSVAFKDSKLLAAFYDGSVRLYSLVVVCHGCTSNTACVCTAAEDATLAVWTLPDGDQDVRPLLSACWNNSILTGIAFSGSKQDTVAVAAYDTDEIRTWTVTGI